METAVEGAGGEGASVAHERLVAYVHALNGDPAPRAGVWREHSYAAGAGSAGGAGAARDANTRTLLQPAPPAPAAELDVEGVEAPPPPPPDPAPPYERGEPLDEDVEEAWEARLEAGARGAAARRLAGAAVAALRALRLARLAGAGGGRGAVRAAARGLRRALAPHWAGGGAGWLHGALLAVLPPRWRALYLEVVAELRRVLPALCARLKDSALPAPAPPPPRAPPACMPMSSRPLLLWLGSGRPRLDARWERRLRALVPTHYIRLPNLERDSVEAWCVAAAGAARAGVAAAAAGAGGARLALGGAGAGAALALQLAGGAGAGAGARPGALLLLAPPLLTAEGPRHDPDDPFTQLRIPTLVVVGGCGGAAWRGGGCGGAGVRRVLLAGADSLLRVPARLRRPAALPQYAVDAAVADECARWLLEVSEGGADGAPDPPSPPPEPAPLAPQPHRRYRKVSENSDEEYAHLPTARPPPPAARPPPPTMRPAPLTRVLHKGSSRAIEIVEGRVVSRVVGATPLALVPPRRAPAPAAPPAPAPADIMSMPIVFADDDAAVASPCAAAPAPAPLADVKGAPSAVTVKSGGGHVKYSKVIVAKRGGGGGGAARGGGAAGAGGARPIVVRGGVRLVRAQPAAH